MSGDMENAIGLSVMFVMLAVGVYIMIRPIPEEKQRRRETPVGDGQSHELPIEPRKQQPTPVSVPSSTPGETTNQLTRQVASLSDRVNRLEHATRDSDEMLFGDGWLL